MPMIRKIASPGTPALADDRRPRTDDRALPAGWVWTTLGEIADTTRKRAHPQEYPNLQFIGLEHLEAHTMRLLGTVPSNEMRSNAEHFWPDDILYGRLRPYLNKVFRADFEGLCSAEFIIFRKTPHLDSKYLQYFLISWDFVTFATHLNEGDRPRVDIDQLSSYPIPLPPLPEQHRIVAAIETQLTRLDAGVAALKRARANLRRYKAAVLAAACAGRLVPQDTSDEPAGALLRRILDERRAKWEAGQIAKMRAQGRMILDDGWRAKYQEPQGTDMEELAELPKGWVWATVDQLASSEPRSIQSGPFGSELLHSEFQSEGILAIGIDNVLDGKFSPGSQHRISLQKFEQLKRFQARPLDVLITVMATIGRCCVVPSNVETAIITKHVYRITVEKSLIDPYYLVFSLLGGSEVRKQLFGSVQGQTRPGINGAILKKLAIPVPPLAEQRRIVAEVERRLSVVAEVEAAVSANLKRAARLRQAILKRAFAGRLAPQDPTDEPASALLERIRMEREGRDGKKGVKQMRMEGM